MSHQKKLPPNIFDEIKPFNFRKAMQDGADETDRTNHWETQAWLDIVEDSPSVFGHCIALRDDDGMGFALNLDRWKGEHVRITIERVPTNQKQFWHGKASAE